jgi:hypothetical protein
MRLSCTAAILFGLLAMESAAAQGTARARVTGTVAESESGAPIPGAILELEGVGLSRWTIADSLGRFGLPSVPPGPQVLRVRRVGFAESRVPFVAPTSGTVTLHVRLARVALKLEQVTVTADPTGRARGELGTASVVDREAIANQTAASLQGILELTPGVPLSPPGLDGVQQISLRTIPVSIPGEGSGGSIGSFGTLIVLDGVPLSNNANLQSTGPRGELSPVSSAGGGVDLRLIPASTLERVEVIRGIPSARYGDLTQGAIVVDTRAGVVRPELLGRYDARTVELSAVGGRQFFGNQLGSGTFDVARTRLAPGFRDDEVTRLTANLAHRAAWRRDPGAPLEAPAGITLDSRVDIFQLLQDTPEQPDVRPGYATRSRDNGVRVLERLRIGTGSRRLEATGSLSLTRQRSSVQSLLLRGALPFTDRIAEGRAIGKFIGGQFLSRVELEGEPWLAFARVEGIAEGALGGFTHTARIGTELRREWNAGAGYQFDIEFPPQVSFNGVNGFDRPRRYDDIAPLVTSSLYADDRIQRTLGRGVAVELQAGARLDVLHDGSTWASGSRDAVLQPRLNAQLSPVSWIRLRGGFGRTAKTPSLAQLSPGLQYYDIVNVNWYTNDPAERLAVLTTFIRDLENPQLGFTKARKAEAGIEIDVPRTDAVVTLVRFDDRVLDAVSRNRRPDFLIRDRFQLSDSTIGTGQPPTIIEPPFAQDTIPILLDRPGNVFDLESRGWEVTALLPEIAAIRTKVELQGAWIESSVRTDALDFGPFNRFSDFQVDPARPRTPYWEGYTRTAQRGLLTARVIHHQAPLGLILTGTFQFSFDEEVRDVGATDTLAFAGYLTRDGQLVPVPAAQRTDPQYADLRGPRVGLLAAPDARADDWFMSLQVAKTLPYDGKVSFYAFNVLDRVGKYATAGAGGRLHPPVRFGLELTMPLGGWGDR